MIRINLLPFRAARKKENIRRQVSVFLLSLVLVVIVAAWFNYLLSGKITTLDKRIADTTAQVEKYNKINQEIADMPTAPLSIDRKMGKNEPPSESRRRFFLRDRGPADYALGIDLSTP